jgi:hypothetical protein
MANTPAASDEYKIRSLINTVRAILGGASPTVGDVTLTTGTSTIVKHPSLNHTSHINLEPTNVAAAVEKAAGTMYVSNRTGGQFTITHSASAAPRTFTYAFRHYGTLSLPSH